MASNSFGNVFRITTWGETHGKAVGVVVDGCPAGLEISEADLDEVLARRAPGRSPYTSPRQEKDRCEILSGVFEGKTTGAPISLIIWNQDVDSSKYTPIKDLLRPGHANFTYNEKYGHFDYRGGGRSSARETACRVAAGAIARKLLSHWGVSVVAYIKEIGGVVATPPDDLSSTYESPIFCPDDAATVRMCALLDAAKTEGESLGGVVEVTARNLPIGLGDPVYEKLEANLAHAMLSIPASKGFEIGSGFAAARMKGSEHNDLFIHQDNKIVTQTNYAGGTLGGISSGMPLIARVAFKPTSSIMKSQDTLDVKGKKAKLQLPEGSRHDPCLTIRAVPVVEAMACLVLADALLFNRSARL